MSVATVNAQPQLSKNDPIDLPVEYRARDDAERFVLGPDSRIRIRGERDEFLRSLLPSPYPKGVTRGDRVTPMQLAAREKYRARESFILTAPTSSGKTVAATAPIFESGRRAVFVYPYRALLYDQASELLRIASCFGYGPQDFGYLYGGVTGAELARQINVRRRFVLATPDKLVSLFLGERTGVMAATALLASADFFFDEIHGYNVMMRRSLIYFLRSVRLYYERQRIAERPTFIFASATTPADLLAEFEENLGIGPQDIITGPSFTGDAEVEVLVPRSSQTYGKHPIAEDMVQRGHATDTIVVVQNPFDAWMIANSAILDRSGLLFVGQDKQAERERQTHLKAFMESPSRYALIGSSAIEAGVDASARHLYLEESTGSSTAQGFGRVARAGQDAHVVYYGNRLHTLAAQGFLRSEYTRQEWNDLIRRINPERPPAEIMAGLAASPYVEYWGAEIAKEIISPQDYAIYMHIRQTSSEGHLAFRGLTPYTSYESGERISFRALFRKKLAIENGKVKGSPSADRYFFAEQRPVVHAHIRRGSDVAYREVNKAIRNGREVTLHHLLARVDFGPFGRHWTVLEIGPNNAHGADFAPDNMLLTIERRPIAGPGLPMSVRFYS